MTYISKTRRATGLNFATGMFHVHNDSCKVSFESVDVNLGFWNLGL